MSTRPAVVITGGAKRLGLAMAEKCLDMGFRVVMHYRSEKKATDRLLARSPRLRSRVTFIQADLTDFTRDIMAEAAAQAGTVIGLINCASDFTRGNVTNADHLTREIAINALAPLRLGNRFRELFGRGWVVNVTDAHITEGNLSFQNYRLSKRLLEDLTRRMALAYAPHIRVNALAPGALLPAKGRPPKEFAALARSIPLRRTGDVASLLRALEYLVISDYVTGQTLYVDGGWHLECGVRSAD